MNISDSNRILDVIFQYSAKIAKEREFIKILDLVTNLGKDLIVCDRCTIWLLDIKKDELWTKVAQGVNTIRIPKNSGIVGASLRDNKAIIINEPYDDSRFNKAIDKQTGYLTKSILVIPMIGLDGEVKGVFQAINRLNENSTFCKLDISRLTLAASFGAKILDAEYLVKINEYNSIEQQKAHQKQKRMIVNDFEDDEVFDIKICYKASDILSGDSYSLYKIPDGGSLIYILDAMGHGLLPSLTSFSVAAAVKQYILTAKSFEDFSQKLLRTFQNMLSDSEQLSCAFIYLDKDLKSFQYFISGMYPAVLQDNDSFIELKSNNPPFMNFTQNINIDTIELKKFQKMLIYSDGLVENEVNIINCHDVSTLLNGYLLDKVINAIEHKDIDDDVTLVYFSHIENSI